ncbi:hypothetical protein VP01_1113g1 [Puccinia sorghi]|uniref:Uncharacterized protein n=1 Tax=Puccinia sorghi TaxID=27349 RepID=A0A0L6VSI4_9BASI|nr:hypothetical protein VP01_1113g1 [Puccinia sorghi]
MGKVARTTGHSPVMVLLYIGTRYCSQLKISSDRPDHTVRWSVIISQRDKACIYLNASCGGWMFSSVWQGGGYVGRKNILAGWNQTRHQPQDTSLGDSGWIWRVRWTDFESDSPKRGRGPQFGDSTRDEILSGPTGLFGVFSKPQAPLTRTLARESQYLKCFNGSWKFRQGIHTPAPYQFSTSAGWSMIQASPNSGYFPWKQSKGCKGHHYGNFLPTQALLTPLMVYRPSSSIGATSCPSLTLPLIRPHLWMPVHRFGTFTTFGHQKHGQGFLPRRYITIPDGEQKLQPEIQTPNVSFRNPLRLHRDSLESAVPTCLKEYWCSISTAPPHSMRFSLCQLSPSTNRKNHHKNPLKPLPPCETNTQLKSTSISRKFKPWAPDDRRRGGELHDAPAQKLLSAMAKPWKVSQGSVDRHRLNQADLAFFFFVTTRLHYSTPPNGLASNLGSIEYRDKPQKPPHPHGCQL